MKISRRWAFVAIGLVVVLLALRLMSRGPSGVEVEAARVAPGPVEDAVTNSQAGTVMSRRRSRLGAAAAGRVLAILRREGQPVRNGERLVQLDDATANQRLAVARRDVGAARAALDQARAAATLARSDYERSTQLRAGSLISQEAMDQSRSRNDAAEAALEGARQQLERAQATVRLAEESLRDLCVTAPFDGVVTQRMVELGEAVVPGQPLLEVMNPDSLYVSAPIDEMDIGRLRVGLAARVTLDPYPGVTWSGTVTRVAPFVNDVQQQNRTLEVEIALPPEPDQPDPKPGSSADVEIVIQRKENVLRVPTSALLEGHRVFVVERGKAKSREVQAGLHNWTWTQVVSGLTSGETIVTSLDRQGLKEGAAVLLRPATNGGAAAAARDTSGP